MEGERGATWSVIDELHSLDIQPDEMEGQSGVSQSIIWWNSFLGYPRI